MPRHELLALVLLAPRLFLAACAAPRSAVLAPATPPVSTHPAKNATGGSGGGACTPSRLNYTCSFDTGSVTIHWTTGGPAPVNECTGAASAVRPELPEIGTGVLHLAVEAPTTGYVGLGFSPEGKMLDSDVVMGWVKADGTTLVNVWFTDDSHYSMSASNAVTPPWTSAMGVTQSQASPVYHRSVTTVCFSRPLAAPSARVSSQLQLGQPVTLIYAGAADGVTRFGHSHPVRGAVSLDLASGTAAAGIVFSNRDKLVIHAALMITAWVALVPLGVLFARHRWVLGDAKLPFFGSHVWFVMHRGIQLSSLILVVVAFAYAWRFLPGPGGGPPVGGDVGQAHLVLGTIVMALAALQVILGLIRPHPGPSRIRAVWTWMHRHLGRLTLACAVTTIFLGIWMGHNALAYQLSYAEWLVPVVVLLGVYLLTDVVLTAVWYMRTSQAAKGADGGAGTGAAAAAPAVPLSSKAAVAGKAVVPDEGRGKLLERV